MSNPAEIEIAGTPDWLVEDTATIPSARSPAVPSDVENGTSWLVDESPTMATNDDTIYAPSQVTKEPSKASTKKDKKSKDKRTKSGNNNKANTDVNVNSGGDNNTSNAVVASQKTWNQYFRESFQRDGRLLLITIALLITMNIPFIHWALYPFTIFSTWIHEMCHGLAALMVGGSITKLEIFPGGGGLAYLVLKRPSSQGFTSSAGYQGTAVVGFLLLIFRRTKRGPRTGTMFLACWMILSCLIWIRNVFGFIFIFAFGLVLAGLAWMLPSFHIRNLYVILAMMTSMNAITTIRYLFRAGHVVNGEPVQSDAHTMSNIVGGSYILWATLWLILAIALTILGIIFAIPGPDEVADFACCGVCQDMGCFKLFNYPGQRWCSQFFGRKKDDSPANNNDNA